MQETNSKEIGKTNRTVKVKINLGINTHGYLDKHQVGKPKNHYLWLPVISTNPLENFKRKLYQSIINIHNVFFRALIGLPNYIK
jgi:hypothetical protein